MTNPKEIAIEKIAKIIFEKGSGKSFEALKSWAEIEQDSEVELEEILIKAEAIIDALGIELAGDEIEAKAIQKYIKGE